MNRIVSEFAAPNGRRKQQPFIGCFCDVTCVEWNVIHKTELAVTNLPAQPVKIRAALAEIRDEAGFVLTFIQRDHVNGNRLLPSGDRDATLPVAHECIGGSINGSGAKCQQHCQGEQSLEFHS